MKSPDRRGRDGDRRIGGTGRGSQKVVLAWRPAQRAALRPRARCGPRPGAGPHRPPDRGPASRRPRVKITPEFPRVSQARSGSGQHILGPDEARPVAIEGSGRQPRAVTKGEGKRVPGDRDRSGRGFHQGQPARLAPGCRRASAARAAGPPSRGVRTRGPRGSAGTGSPKRCTVSSIVGSHPIRIRLVVPCRVRLKRSPKGIPGETGGRRGKSR